MGFVDLTGIPEESNMHCANLDPISPGIHAIAQATEHIEDKAEIGCSKIFLPLGKTVGGLTQNRVSHLELFLADVKSFVSPAAVIPDLGGQPNDYFLVKERVKWGEDFVSWLRTPSADDNMEDSEHEDSGEEQQNYMELEDLESEDPASSEEDSDTD